MERALFLNPCRVHTVPLFVYVSCILLKLKELQASSIFFCFIFLKPGCNISALQTSDDLYLYLLFLCLCVSGLAFFSHSHSFLSVLFGFHLSVLVSLLIKLFIHSCLCFCSIFFFLYGFFITPSFLFLFNAFVTFTLLTLRDFM